MNPQLQITLNQSESIIISLSQHSVTHPQVRIIPTVFCAYELDLCQGRLDLWQDGRKAEKGRKNVILFSCIKCLKLAWFSFDTSLPQYGNPTQVERWSWIKN